MVKQPACAAAINSSGVGANAVLQIAWEKEYCAFDAFAVS